MIHKTPSLDIVYVELTSDLFQAMDEWDLFKKGIKESKR